MHVRTRPFVFYHGHALVILLNSASLWFHGGCLVLKRKLKNLSFVMTWPLANLKVMKTDDFQMTEHESQ